MAQSLLAGIAPQSPDFGQSFLAGRSAVRDDQQQGLQLQQNKQTAAMRTAEIIGRFAVDADTPEKWAAGMQAAAALGVPDAAQYADKFGMRDQIIHATRTVADQSKTQTAGRFLGSLPQGAGMQSRGSGVLGTLPMPGPAPAGAAPPVGTVATKPVAPMSTAQPSNYAAQDSAAPASLVGSAGMDTLRPTLARSESGGNPSVVNAQGYSGRYQMGEGALQTAGLYSDPTPGVKNDWQGSFSIPGHPEVRTHEDFLRSPQAQEDAFDVYKADLERQMNGLGLGQYVGQTVGGVPITEDGMIMMAHLGGVTGARKFLETNGGYDPSDSNGTHLSDYARRAAGGGGGNVRPATRDVQAPQPNGVPISSLQDLASDPAFAETAVDAGLKQFGTPTDTTVWAKLDDGRLFNQRTGEIREAPGASQGGVALSAEQAKALGFAPGTVVQRKKDGTLDVLQKPSESGLGGPFQGNGLDAQDSNILLGTDPSAPEYAMAYQRQYMTPKIVQIPDPNNPGALMSATVIVSPPAGIRPPSGMAPRGAQQAPQQAPGAAPNTQSPVGPQPAPAAPQQQSGPVSVQGIPGTSKLPSQPVPAEVAGRIGLANQFLDNDLPGIRQAIQDGAMNGVYERGQLALGAGTPGVLLARVQTGIDALRRNLTGAGMNNSEASEYANRYLPSVTDGSDRMLDKLNGLEADLKATRDAVLAGRSPVPELAGNSRSRPSTMPGQQGQSQPGADNLQTIATPEEAARLPIGTRFRTPDGEIRERK